MKFMKTEIFRNFWKISAFSLIDEVRVFRMNIKLLSNLVTLPFHSLKNYGLLEKEKNSNFNVENFVVMFIY
jgi:hypothetical protein